MLTPLRNTDRTLSPFDALSRQMDSLQHLYFGERLPRRRMANARPAPAEATATLTDDDAVLTLAVDLPGLRDKDVELSVTPDALTIKATRHIEAPAGYRVHRQERTDYALARSYALPVNVDPAKVEARMKNGVLTVTLPKAPTAKPRTVPIVAE